LSLTHCCSGIIHGVFGFFWVAMHHITNHSNKTIPSLLTQPNMIFSSLRYWKQKKPIPSRHVPLSPLVCPACTHTVLSESFPPPASDTESHQPPPAAPNHEMPSRCRKVSAFNTLSYVAVSSRLRCRVRGSEWGADMRGRDECGKRKNEDRGHL
jgi:hypothetical protein